MKPEKLPDEATASHGDAPYYGSAEPLVPDSPNLELVRDAALTCKACHLWKCGTQTVFGEGNPHARIMFVGEQPGDQEDREGRPFVGPSGQLLERAMGEAGIERSEVYITNAVKHFKWIPQSGRRLHQKPNTREVRACRPWLEAEIARVRPEAILLLGATAAQAILGPEFRLTQHRGEFVESTFAKHVLATNHPSAILRMRSDERESAYAAFVEDMRSIAAKVGNSRRYMA